MNKNVFRKECLERRKQLKKENLTEKILELPEYKNAKTVFVYVSHGSEIETSELIREALKDKQVLVPYCMDSSGIMIACEISSFDDLSEGMYKIYEPKNPEEFKGDIDLSIVPGVAFSYDGYRIGYGKGYYDRFLAKNRTFSIGITYDELLFDSIPHNEYDFRLDMILTPGKEIRI